MIEARTEKKANGILSDLSHIGQGLLGLSVLWDVIPNMIMIITRLAGRIIELPKIWELAIPPGGIPCEALGPLAPTCRVVVGCIVVSGLIKWLVIDWICEKDWVQEETTWSDCWEEIVWYNPWTWAKTLVCIVKSGLKWVLQKICGNKAIVVWAAVAVCIIALL